MFSWGIEMDRQDKMGQLTVIFIIEFEHIQGGI